jgi:hypothetical protein
MAIQIYIDRQVLEKPVVESLKTITGINPFSFTPNLQPAVYEL